MAMIEQKVGFGFLFWALKICMGHYSILFVYLWVCSALRVVSRVWVRRWTCCGASSPGQTCSPRASSTKIEGNYVDQQQQHIQLVAGGLSGLVAQSCYPATWEARTRDSLRLPGLASPFVRWINIRTLSLYRWLLEQSQRDFLCDSLCSSRPSTFKVSRFEPQRKRYSTLKYQK